MKHIGTPYCITQLPMTEAPRVERIYFRTKTVMEYKPDNYNIHRRFQHKGYRLGTRDVHRRRTAHSNKIYGTNSG